MTAHRRNTGPFGRPFDLPTAMAHLEAQARARWQLDIRTRRWTFWVLLSFRRPASDISATKTVEAFAARLQRAIPGAALVVGLHTDTGRVHAHGLVFLPGRAVSPPHGGPWTALTQRWLQSYWRCGRLWVAEYRPFQALSAANPRTHGAPVYLTKEVGTVMQCGQPPRYVPARSRARRQR